MLTSLLQNPFETLRSLLIMLPGLVLALCLHESAHGYIAEKCGDPTARMMGRISLNPAKHFDAWGFLCMLFIGFGWAKPVPVNPNNFRDYRRDDLKVALAGITANLCLFFVSAALMMAMFTGALATLPKYETAIEQYNAYNNGETYVYTVNGEKRVMTPEGYLDEEALFKYGAYMSDEVIKPAFGEIVAILYEMLMYSAVMNISLAVFNLIPLPPLDGYHVLNDLVLKQDLFAQRKTQRIAGGILTALIIIGNRYPDLDIIGKAISGVRSYALTQVGALARFIAQAIGVI